MEEIQSPVTHFRMIRGDALPQSFYNLFLQWSFYVGHCLNQQCQEFKEGLFFLTVVLRPSPQNFLQWLGQSVYTPPEVREQEFERVDESVELVHLQQRQD